MSLLSALMLKIGADSSGLRKELKGTKNGIKNAFSVDPIITFQNALTGTAANVGVLINKFNAASVLIGSGFGLTALITNAVNAGAAVKDLADKLQISTAEADNFSRVIKLTGGDVDTAAAAMMRLDTAMSGNSENAQRIRTVLDAVGVSVTDQEGKLLPLNEQLKKLAQGYQAAAQAGYGQEFIMNTLGVRGMALTETLMKYNDAAEDASKIKGIGLDVEQMAEIDRELQIVQAQLGQLALAGGALLAPIAEEVLPAITSALATTAQLISENKQLITEFGIAFAAGAAMVQVNDIAKTAGLWTSSITTAAVETEELTSKQIRSIDKRVAAVEKAAEREKNACWKKLKAVEMEEEKRTQTYIENCNKIEAQTIKTANKIRTEMTAAYQKVNAAAKVSAAGQVQAIATTGNAAQAAGTKTVVASTAAKGAVSSLTATVKALATSWYFVAAAISYAYEWLSNYRKKQLTNEGVIGADVYDLDGEQYRRSEDGRYYRRTINQNAEDARDTYIETEVVDEDALKLLNEEYLKKHPVPNNTQPDTEKLKKAFNFDGGSSEKGGKSKGSSGKEVDPEKEEMKNRQALQRSIEQEYAMRRTVNDAMRESVDLQAAYMTAAQKAAYEMQKEHEKAVEGIKSRWLQFETEYIGMSDTDRARMIKNLEEVGAAYEITEDGRLSMAKQVAADIEAVEKQYDDAIIEYHTQCKDILAEIDEAYRLNSMEKLQESLTNENALILNAYNTKQNMMKRYYDNWLITHQSTSDMVANIVMNSQSSFENFFKDILSGAKSFNDSLLDLLSGLLDAIVKQIAEMMAAKVVNQFLNWIMPGKFADGGMVNTPIGGHGVSYPRSPGKASGGFIIGAGTSTSDSIPAMLSNGEFVMSAAAVRRIGVPYLNRLNKGYANGGLVAGSTASGSFGGPANIQINIQNETGQQLEAREAGSSFDGEKYILNLILKFVNNNDGGLRTMIKGVAAT